MEYEKIVHQIKCSRCHLCYPRDYYVSFTRQREPKPTKSCFFCRINNVGDKRRHGKVISEIKSVWEEWKRNNPCVDCGCKDERVIQADHISNKTAGCGNYTYWGRESLGVEKYKEELKKCQARCRFCHMIKTKKELFDTNVSRDKLWKGPSAKYNNSLKHRVLKYDLVDQEKLYRQHCLQCHRKVTKDTCQAFIFDHGCNWRNKTWGISEYIRKNNCSFTKAKPLILREMYKCRLLCANCDWIATKNDLWGEHCSDPDQVNPDIKHVQDIFFIKK